MSTHYAITTALHFCITIGDHFYYIAFGSYVSMKWMIKQLNLRAQPQRALVPKKETYCVVCLHCSCSYSREQQKGCSRATTPTGLSALSLFSLPSFASTFPFPLDTMLTSVLAASLLFGASVGE